MRRIHRALLSKNGAAELPPLLARLRPPQPNGRKAGNKPAFTYTSPNVNLTLGWGAAVLPVGYIDAGLKLISFTTGIFLVYFDRPCKEV
jgi:hypothetical protein